MKIFLFRNGEMAVLWSIHIWNSFQMGHTHYRVITCSAFGIYQLILEIIEVFMNSRMSIWCYLGITKQNNSKKCLQPRIQR